MQGGQAKGEAAGLPCRRSRAWGKRGGEGTRGESMMGVAGGRRVRQQVRHATLAQPGFGFGVEGTGCGERSGWDRAWCGPVAAWCGP